MQRELSAWERSYEPRPTRYRAAMLIVLIGGLVGGVLFTAQLTHSPPPADAHRAADAQLAVRPLSGFQTPTGTTSAPTP